MMRRTSTKARAAVRHPSQDSGDVGGRVTWLTVDGVAVPCIQRGKPHGPVRVLEGRLLNRLSSTAAVNAAFRDRPLLVSKYLTDDEASLLTGAAGQMLGEFTSKDLVVDMDQFNDLYTYLKSMLHKPATAAPVTGGWLQVNNSVIPYVLDGTSKLLPLPVLVNAAGLLSHASMLRILPLRNATEPECRYLNELCSSAGLEFTFDTTTSLVDMHVMYVMAKPAPYMRELPANDPFSHAQFINEHLLLTQPLSSSVPAVQSSPWHSTYDAAVKLPRPDLVTLADRKSVV